VALEQTTLHERPHAAPCVDPGLLYAIGRFWTVCLGSGLIDHIQKVTMAAMAIADMKVWAQRSCRVWMRLQPLSFPYMFSILCRLR